MIRFSGEEKKHGRLRRRGPERESAGCKFLYLFNAQLVYLLIFGIRHHYADQIGLEFMGLCLCLGLGLKGCTTAPRFLEYFRR